METLEKKSKMKNSFNTFICTLNTIDKRIGAPEDRLIEITHFY